MTRLTGLQKSLLLGMLNILLVVQAPLTGDTEGSSTDFNISAGGDNQSLANKMLVLVDVRSIFVDA